MTLNLDDDQYMDDLFGDGGHVVIPAPVVIIKGLSQTLDHLACSNACQKIAWSQDGRIAAISPDRKSVRLYVLIRNSKTGLWALSKPAKLDMESNEDHDIVHISWNSLGAILSVIDSCGRISIYDSAPPHNTSGRMTQVRTGENDSDSDMEAVAASYWCPILPYAPTRPFAQSASFQNSSWSYNIVSRSLAPIGPYNSLIAASALLVLTKRGTLRILYQQADFQFSEDKIVLDHPIVPLDDFVTHGAFAPYSENGLLLATYDNSRRLRVFLINIFFKNTENEKKGEPGQPAEKIKVTFEIKNLAFESNICPQPADPFANDSATNAGVPGEQYALTHLEMLSLVQHSSQRTSPPTVFAVFSLVAPQYHGTPSIVCRWHLKEGSESALPVWDELPVLKKRASDLPPRKEHRLERVSDMTLPSTALSVSVVRQYTIIAFTMSDGSVQFRFRDSLEQASADGSYEEVQSLPQMGFSFPLDEPPLFAALSPSACCSVTLNSDGDVKLRKMAYEVGDVSQIKDDDAHFGAFSAVFALYFVTAWLNYSTADDLMAIFPTYMHKSLATSAMDQSCLAIQPQGSFNFVQPTQALLSKLYQSGLLEKVMGVYCVLHVRNDGHMTQAGKLSWSTLNLRTASGNLITYNQSIMASAQLEDIKSDFGFILGTIRWLQDLITYVIQELHDMAFELGDKINDKEALLAFGEPRCSDYSEVMLIYNERMRKHHSPGMHLLLCSVTRLLIRNTIRTLRRSYDIGVQILKAKKSDPNGAVWTLYFKAFRECPLAPAIYRDDPPEAQTQEPNKSTPSLRPLEALIGDVDTAIRKCYRDAELDERGMQTSERDMFLRCDIPDFLLPAATFMIKRAQEIKKVPGVSELALWGHDISWLGVTDELTGDNLTTTKNGMRVDVVRKSALGQSKYVKMCPRCRSATEDFGDAQQPGPPPWFAKSTRSCVCGERWVIQEEDTEAINGNKFIKPF